MKKILMLAATMVMLSTSTAFAAAKYNDVYKDWETKAVSGTLMVEARKFFDEISYECTWDAETKTSTFSNGTNTVSISTVTGDVNVDGQLLNEKSVMYDGTTYIPYELIEKLNVVVLWDNKNNYPLFYDGYNKADTTGKNASWNDDKTEYYIDGEKQKGLQLIDGKVYNFGNDGVLRSGVFTDENGIHGYDEYGNKYNGFTEYNGKTYYFNNGMAYNKPSDINDKMYNFAEDGTLTTGWSTSDGKKMYFNEFGYPVEGIVEIDGAKYYFINGVMQTGKVVYNDKNYFLYDDGIMATDKVMDDFYYDTDGVGIQYSQEYIRLRNRANEILAQTGKNPQAIYTYVCNHVKYKYDPQKDWTTMANSAFDSGRGACYNFAACVDILLKLSGYETRVVRGTGHYTSLHYWNQVKINGAWTNIDACNKYYNVSDAYLKSKTYTFDKYEYPQYY